MSFEVGDQVTHKEFGAGEIVWVYRAGVLVEFAGEDHDRHCFEHELDLTRKARR